MENARMAWRVKDNRSMGEMRTYLSLLLGVCCVASAQLSPVPPPPTGTPSHPFFITKTWIVGGIGDWDYMTMDPQAHQLFIAHGPTVQIIDVETGEVAGIVKGLRDAHCIVLDAGGTYGYVSDGPADMVRVFDRRDFQVIANIPTGPSPRSMALDSASGLLFVVGSQATATANAAGGTARDAPTQTTRSPRESASRRTLDRGGAESTITVIDVERKVQLGQILLPGSLGFAQGDGSGRVYITVSDRDQILRLDAAAMGAAIRRAIDTLPAPGGFKAARAQSIPNRLSEKPPVLDWTAGSKANLPSDAYPMPIRLDSNCEHPRALAIDTAHERLFAACSNLRMVVLNAANGQVVSALPIGPGADAIGYDPDRGLIFTANGGSDGSLTIIRQDVTDTYSVIQTLPTRQNARTLAIDPANGEVYLTTVLYGAELNRPPINGAPLKINAVDSSFQVLVVGN
jgi:DNA-binding beta-propeller fold protein YncE